jgi:hypothetical protein
VVNQAKRLPVSITTRAFNEVGHEVRRVPKGYGQNRPFRRRETSAEVYSAFGFAPGNERFCLLPRADP